MTETNAEIINWIRFAKGDTPGHEFHGNQYSDGGVGAAKELHSEIGHSLAGMDNVTDYPSADNHREFATAHDRLAASAPTPELREGHKVAANYHRQAADDNDIAERRSGRGSTGDVAADASYDALTASNKVLTDHINYAN